jgi:hypothetical protein
MIMVDESAPEKKKPVWLLVLGACGCLALAGLALLVVVAIALPGITHSPRASLETYTVGNLRAYCSAQTMYRRNDYDKNDAMDYATPYTKLYGTKDASSDEIMFIDAAFAAAQGPTGTPEHGYLYQDMQTIAGEKIDWVNDYALCATPAVYGRSGYRTFIVCTNGTVYGKDLGSSQFVTDYPLDPGAQGWIVCE